ncbi:hypothetical protein I316_05432 [Kwoniella heveanensis BCC8398]|uniref:RING-type domain-containing protein n=1 Tax=Kwoniella heveanensis BCC8398 TaxID=1296120 RepID=A0A1B9GP64_9TREE|nr:hypothetical protein I316_05432 [Kwoniella heveanensis BCC8398]
MSSPPPPPPPNPGDNTDSNNSNRQPSFFPIDQASSSTSPHASASSDAHGVGSPPSITFEFTLPGLLDGSPSNTGSLGLNTESRQDTVSGTSESQGGQQGSHQGHQSPRPDPTAGVAPASGAVPNPRAGNEEAGHGALDILWSFTIRADPSAGLPSIGLHPPPPSSPGQNPLDPHMPNTRGSGENNPSGAARNETGGPQGLPPPWLFPPFFNFFMPLRTEPQPNPEKAAELLRSLPTVTRVSLARVDRIVAAQEKDSPPDEKGWKCGICLEGIPTEDTKGKGKAKEDRSEGTEGATEKIDVDPKEDEGEEKHSGTGVKALPCNHLFHADCLEPWFLTKHTCPSCRLDLDPLQTLNTGPPRQNPLRPSATTAGATRLQNAHPYARNNGNSLNGASANNRPTTEQPQSSPHAGPLPAAFSPPGMPSADGGQGQNSQDQGPTITFFWSASPGSASLPGFNPFRSLPLQNPNPVQRQESISPMTVPPGQTSQGAPSVGVAATPQDTTAAQTSDSAITAGRGENHAGLTAPSTPGPIFDAPTFASPLQMASRSSPAPAPGAIEEQSQSASPNTSTAAPVDNNTHGAQSPTPIPIPTGPFGIAGASAGGDNRPQPQRRPHITIIRTPSPGLGPVPGSGSGPLPFGFPFLPLPQHLTPGAGLNRTPQPPSAPSDPSPSGPHNETASAIESTGSASPMNTSFTSDQRGGPTETSAQAQGPASVLATAKPFAPQSLENWILDRETTLGWRCDAPDCFYYKPPPSGAEDGDVQMAEEDRPDGAAGNEDDDKEGKQILSVFSVDQPLDRPYSNRSVNICTTEEPPVYVPEIRVEDTEPASPREGGGETSSSNGMVALDLSKSKFAVLACRHRYHRKCVSRLEKLLSPPSSNSKGDTNGDRASASAENDRRLFVRCARCHKDGWVRSADAPKHVLGAVEAQKKEGDHDEVEVGLEDEEYAPSEREVEHLIAD